MPPGLEDNIDFSLLSDEDLEKLLAEETEKRKHLAPTRSKIVAKGKVVGGEKRKVPRAQPEAIEVDLD